MSGCMAVQPLLDRAAIMVSFTHRGLASSCGALAIVRAWGQTYGGLNTQRSVVDNRVLQDTSDLKARAQDPPVTGIVKPCVHQALDFQGLSPPDAAGWACAKNRFTVRLSKSPRVE